MAAPAASLAAGLGHLLPLSVKGARSLRHLGLPPDQACARKHGYQQFDRTAKSSALFAAILRHAVRDSDPFAPFRRAYAACQSSDPLDRSMYVDVKTYLADDILTKVDKMSMAVSLEARVPLLDHKLLEFAARVPSSLKLRGGVASTCCAVRWIAACRARSSTDRNTASPRRLPNGCAVRSRRWPGSCSSTVSSTDRGIFRESGVTRLWNEHQQGQRDHRHRLWSLVMLELWFRGFADRGRRAAAA